MELRVAGAVLALDGMEHDGYSAAEVLSSYSADLDFAASGAFVCVSQELKETKLVPLYFVLCV